MKITVARLSSNNVSEWLWWICFKIGILVSINAYVKWVRVMQLCRVLLPQIIICLFSPTFRANKELFTVYINDFHRFPDIPSFILFADDSNIFLSNHDSTELITTLNDELKKTTHWIKATKLSLNFNNKKNHAFQ